MNVIKILHLESTDPDSESIKEILQSCDFKYVYRRIAALTELEGELLNFNPSIILANYVLYTLRHKQIFSFINQADHFIPLILIGDTYSREISLQMAGSGASDFIFKDRIEHLPLSIANIFNRVLAEKEVIKDKANVISSEKKFQALLENISDTIILTDEKGVIAYQSPSAEKITGFTPGETLDSTIFKFIHPADLQMVTQNLTQAIDQPGVPVNNFYRIQLKNGDFIWVEGTFTNFLNDPNICSVIVNYRNVTQRKYSEDKLQKSEANLRTIFDNTNISYILCDKHFRLLSYNSAAELIYAKEFKVQLKEGSNILDFLPEERKTSTRKTFEKVLAGEKVNYELSFIQVEGSSTWYDVNMFAVHDDSNNLLGFIISSENITQRKENEFERNKMLKDIVLQNKDLEQFAYIISHNLRSPVANILGISGLIENTPDMDKKTFDECMKGLALSVKKLDDVIIDLNSILQTRRGINEKKKTVVFPDLISDIKTSISGLLEGADITIETNFEVKEFFTLKSYIHSIFFNLISNSIKYRKPSIPLMIHIQSKIINNKLILEFRDNGLGIDLNTHRQNIFGLYKKFHQHIEGKGVGLYMVKTQVEMLEGKISVASEVNTGTTFTLEFEKQA